MSAGHLFEFVIIYHPRASKAQIEANEHPKSEVIVGVQEIWAKDEDEARVIAARRIPEKYADKISDVQILVRPF